MVSVGKSRPRTVAGSVRAALDVAVQRGEVDPDLDAGLAAVALRLAHALDVGDPAKDPYGYARVARVLLQVLQEARLTPPSRAGLGDEMQRWLADLAVPTPGTPTPGEPPS